MKPFLVRIGRLIKKYERHLSAIAMISGFVVDNHVFARVDILRTQILLGVYAAACFIAIPLVQWLRFRAEKLQKQLPRWYIVFPLIVQFALGGFWSAFVIFYSRSAYFGVSWPFLLFLFLVFLGSEYFHRYHQQMVFTSVLFFLALYSYAIFEVPVFTGRLGVFTFMQSTVVAIAVFTIFTIVLRIFVREKFLGDVWRIRIGAASVLVVMNIFYFTNILPPLPLAAPAAGVYHAVTRVPGAYLGTEEAQAWYVRYLGFAPTEHVVLGNTLSAYSSVFAPTTLRTTIVHHWEWYSPTTKSWITEATIKYPIIGGRDGGYRGYSTVAIRKAGAWRVSVQTDDGRVITQMPFTVIAASSSPAETTITLK